MLLSDRTLLENHSQTSHIAADQQANKNIKKCRDERRKKSEKVAAKIKLMNLVAKNKINPLFERERKKRTKLFHLLFTLSVLIWRLKKSKSEREAKKKKKEKRNGFLHHRPRSIFLFFFPTFPSFSL